jgi:hypothetical protein
VRKRILNLFHCSYGIGHIPIFTRENLIESMQLIVAVDFATGFFKDYEKIDTGWKVFYFLFFFFS